MRSAGGRWLRFGRFNLVGLLGAALQLVLLYVLTKCLRVPVIAATPVAVEIVVLHNFVWHERLTWRDRRFKNVRQRALALWRFHVGNGLISLVGNTAVTYCLVERLKASVLPSAIGGIVLCSLVNFFVADWWVYARRPGLYPIEKCLELIRSRLRPLSSKPAFQNRLPRL